MPFSGLHNPASRASVLTLAIFASQWGAKMLVGEPPQTQLSSGQSVPKWRRFAPYVCGPGAIAPSLSFKENGKSRGAVLTRFPGQSSTSEMLTAFCKNGAGYVIVLPPQKPRLKPLENRAFFQAKFQHISLVF